ncbi:MAG: putative addiction module antidote protein [Chloroflexi bacterium]|nr:putative addiction module antidote protein [Chloroflexota bacterium]
MRKKKITASLWDASEHLETDEDISIYSQAALEGGDPALISAVLGDIAKAKGMTQIAKKTGMSRTSLYKALSPEGHPEFATILKVLDALDLKLRATSLNTKLPTKHPI